MLPTLEPKPSAAAVVDLNADSGSLVACASSFSASASWSEAVLALSEAFSFLYLASLRRCSAVMACHELAPYFSTVSLYLACAACARSDAFCAPT